VNEAEGKTYQDVLRAFVALQGDGRFALIHAFFAEMLEKYRQDLEVAKDGFREIQGRVAALREILHHIDNAKETLRALESAGQSDNEPTR